MRYRLTERDLSRIVRRVVNEETSNIKQEYIDEIKSLLDSMQNSNEHNADTVAQIIVNNSNFFLTRQKQWSDRNKYGEPPFTDSEVKYLNSDTKNEVKESFRRKYRRY